MDKDQWTQEVSLEEFRNTGLPLYINQILHIFGYAVGFDVDEDGKATRMFPMRCRFRGFSPDIIQRNYKKLNQYMKDNAAELYDEAEYDKDKEKE